MTGCGSQNYKIIILRRIATVFRTKTCRTSNICFMAHLQTSPQKNTSISIHDLYLVWLPGTLQPSTEVHDCRMIFITFRANWLIPLEELSSTILGTSICKEVKLCDLTDGWENEAKFGYHPIFGLIFECFHVTSKPLLSLKVVVPCGPQYLWTFGTTPKSRPKKSSPNEESSIAMLKRSPPIDGLFQAYNGHDKLATCQQGMIHGSPGHLTFFWWFLNETNLLASQYCKIVTTFCKIWIKQKLETQQQIFE